jgi:hypothetical protein
VSGEKLEFGREMPGGAGRDAVDMTRAGLHAIWNLGV